MAVVKKKRWYDSDKRLARQLDGLMKVRPKNELKVIQGLVDIIKAYQPEILTLFTIPDDIDKWYRRWYDHDPTYWIVINGLKHAHADLHNKVVAYLEKQLGKAGPVRAKAAAKKRKKK